MEALEAKVRELLEIDAERDQVARETQWGNIEEGLARTLPVMTRYKACIADLRELLDE